MNKKQMRKANLVVSIKLVIIVAFPFEFVGYLRAILGICFGKNQ